MGHHVRGVRTDHRFSAADINGHLAQPGAQLERESPLYWSTVGPSSRPLFFQMSQCTHRALQRLVIMKPISVGLHESAKRPPPECADCS
jgi:hypothetical protein